MMYPSAVIAGQFVNKGIADSNPVTQMKLQKIVFFAHGLHLMLNNGKPLISDNFLAWKFGPVVPSIYQVYKRWGNFPIIEKSEITINNEPLSNFTELSQSAIEAINTTWDITKDVDAITLSNWSHAKGSPWDYSYNSLGENSVIDNQRIKEYFEQHIKSAEHV